MRPFPFLRHGSLRQKSIFILALLALSSAIEPAYAFRWAHIDITAEGLGAVAYEIDRNLILKFHKRAVNQVVLSNLKRDAYTLAGLVLGGDKYHCDADQIAQCVGVVHKEFEEIVALLIQADAANKDPGVLSDLALELAGLAVREGKFGALLHTVQDFYSHSNWIELGNRFVDFGEPWASAMAPGTRGGTLSPCPMLDGTTVQSSGVDRSKLGSGHFFLLDTAAAVAVAQGHCIHGPNGTIYGISADTEARGEKFDRASQKATYATTQIAQKILGRLRDAGAYRAMCAFVGEAVSRCPSMLCGAEGLDEMRGCMYQLKSYGSEGKDPPIGTWPLSLGTPIPLDFVSTTNFNSSTAGNSTTTTTTSARHIVQLYEVEDDENVPLVLHVCKAGGSWMAKSFRAERNVDTSGAFPGRTLTGPNFENDSSQLTLSVNGLVAAQATWSSQTNHEIEVNGGSQRNSWSRSGSAVMLVNLDTGVGSYNYVDNNTQSLAATYDQGGGATVSTNVESHVSGSWDETEVDHELQYYLLPIASFAIAQPPAACN